MKQVENDEIRRLVRENYEKVSESGGSGCGCSPSSDCYTDTKMSVKKASVNMGYSDDDVNTVPDGANMGQGCGNPQAIASLKPGEIVLDLGSGGGFDCFLAAKAVGEQGYVIGVDMTPEMVSKSRRNAVTAGFGHVEFRLGEIEHLPVADNQVDVIISNCVINLSPDKKSVFKDSFRVLKPGGRLAIYDIVSTSELPDNVRQDMNLLTGCMSGASDISEIESMLREVGFLEIRVKQKDESREFIREWAPGHKIDEYLVSATVEAIKPEA